MTKRFASALSIDDLPLRVVARFLDCVDMPEDPTDCWIWMMSLMRTGYGQIGWQDQGQRSHQLAHRIAYVVWHGPIPEGLVVDHLCHRRACCNPHHLRLTTNAENAADNGQPTKTHCPRGHPYDEINTYHDAAGGRRCRACARITKRVWVALNPPNQGEN